MRVVVYIVCVCSSRVVSLIYVYTQCNAVMETRGECHTVCVCAHVYVRIYMVYVCECVRICVCVCAGETTNEYSRSLLHNIVELKNRQLLIDSCSMSVLVFMRVCVCVCVARVTET